MSWQLPSEEEIIKEDALKPKKCEDLPEGPFVGMIEVTETFTENDGTEKFDTISTGVRVISDAENKYNGELILKYINVMTKKGKVNRNGYNFLKNLLEPVRLGNPWHPSDLTFIKFAARVEYSRGFWDFRDVEFIEKVQGFDL